MPLYRRTPKRGFKPISRQKWSVVNVGDLGRVDGDEVDPEVLLANGLIRTQKHPVKILARGDAERAMTIRAHAFSDAARQKIEAAGGTAAVIE